MSWMRFCGRVCFSVLSISILSACSGDQQSNNYVGYVEAEYVYVAAPQSGWLTSLQGREGDEAVAGDILFELDKDQQIAAADDAAGRLAQAEAQLRNLESGARPEEIDALEAQLAEANARLTQARSERNRWLPLVREGNASRARGDQVQADYDTALAQVRAAKEAIEVAKLAARDAAQDAAAAAVTSAKANLAQAQWRLDQRSVKAKAGGRIENVFHRQGEFVTAGAPVFSILPASGLKVRFFAPQAALPKFSTGARVLVDADGLDAPIEAIISYIAAEAEFTPPVIYSIGSRDKLVFLIEARLSEGGKLRPGLPVDVSLP